MSLTASTPTGERFWLYASDEVPTLTTTQSPSIDVAAQAYDSPVQLSTDGTKAFRWIVNTAGTFSRQAVDRAAAIFFSYLPLRTPAGVEKAILLDNTGVITIEAFEPSTRRLTTVLLKRGPYVYVPDSRFPAPPQVRGARIGGRQ